MTFSEIFNIIIGGGLVVTLVKVITLKAAVRKANAEAAQAQAEAKKAEAEAETAKAEAESVRITNTENATRILVENIVKPLREELVAMRREVRRLRRAMEAASECPHSKSCPVIHKLRSESKSSEEEDGEGLRQEIVRNKNDP